MSLPVTCRFCGRKLTGKLSIERRAGPACAAKNRARFEEAELVEQGNRLLFPDSDQTTICEGNGHAQ